MTTLEDKKAPAFSLEGSDGKRHSLSDYKGQTKSKHWRRVPKAETHAESVLATLP